MNPASDLALGLADFTMLRPWWLLALLPCWALPWLLFRKSPVPYGNWTGVVDAELLPHLVQPVPSAHSRNVRALLVAGLTLGVIALSGPALKGRSDVALRSDAMRVLVVDLSPALGETGENSGLIEVLQVKLLDLLARMPEGHTALIAYAEEPYLLAPPTTDTATLRMLATELSPDVLPLAGNRPERALRMAVNLLERSGAQTRDVLWLHTGGNVSTPSLQAIVGLKRKGVTVSRLRLPVDEDVRDDLHEAVLASGGVDLPRRADDRDVTALLAHLARGTALRPGPAPTTATPHDLGPCLLALLLPFAALAFRRGVFVLLAGMLVLQPPAAYADDVMDMWQRPDQRAIQALSKGAAESAAAGFTDARWKAVAHYRAGNYAESAVLLEAFGDADSLYNRGNALARLQRLDEALQAYDAALQQRPDDPDILHNRDLIRELMKRPPPPQSGQSQSGKNPPPSPPGAPSSATPPPPAPVASQDIHEQEAGHLAEQWLRRVPDEPAGLLRRKLELEHRRRQSGEAPRPW